MRKHRQVMTNRQVSFGGRRYGADDETAISATVENLAPLAAEAGSADVTLVLETLNTKVDHPEHQCDRSWWTFEVARRVGLPG